jgi:hypothetical protein
MEFSWGTFIFTSRNPEGSAEHYLGNIAFWEDSKEIVWSPLAPSYLNV